MILSEAYLKEREKLLEQGRQQAWQEGYQEGRRQITENVLVVRFGALDEQLAGAIAPMLQLPPEELAPLLLTLSREELLERFGEGV